VSPADIKRLFSEAGMLLTKQRKRMLPNIMKKFVYIRYKKKYRKWVDRLAISVSEEELKKGIEEDGADGPDAEVDDDMADCSVTLRRTIYVPYMISFFSFLFSGEEYVKLILHLVLTDAFV
jgi:hypothetical protein